VPLRPATGNETVLASRQMAFRASALAVGDEGVVERRAEP
jgi:hypothetical protein